MYNSFSIDPKMNNNTSLSEREKIVIDDTFLDEEESGKESDKESNEEEYDEEESNEGESGEEEYDEEESGEKSDEESDEEEYGEEESAYSSCRDTKIIDFVDYEGDSESDTNKDTKSIEHIDSKKIVKFEDELRECHTTLCLGTDKIIREANYSTPSEFLIKQSHSHSKSISKEFEKINYTLNILQNTVLERIESLYSHILNIEKRIIRLEINTRMNLTEIEGEIVTIKEIKMERLDVSEEITIKAMVFKDYRSVLAIFRHYYRSVKNGKTFYPIRIKSKRSYDYFLNNNWIYDSNGHYITKVLIDNIQTLFMRYNNITNKKITQSEWLSNQQFITTLSKEKVKRDMFKHIVEELITTAGVNSVFVSR